MKRFANDWPTQALAMQLLKNKWSHSYCCGYLEVQEMYAYLKDNAAKKKTEAGHSTRGEEGGNNNVASGLICLKSKHVVPVPVATQELRRKQKKGPSDSTNTHSIAKGKGKPKKVCLATESEEDFEDEMEQETDGMVGPGE